MKKPVTTKTKEDRSTTKKGTKITDAVNVERQTGQDNTYVPPSPLNAETVKREFITAHYDKMCRKPKRVQHVDKTTSSAEENNWDHDKIQRINNSKKKNNYIVTKNACSMK